MKKTEELRKLDRTKLAEALQTGKKDLFKITFEVRNGQTKNSHKIRKHRKQIAQIKTRMTELQQSTQEEAETEVTGELK